MHKSIIIFALASFLLLETKAIYAADSQNGSGSQSEYPSPKFFKTVEIKGKITGYQNYNNWIVFVDTGDKQKEKMFPVSAHGEFQIALKNMPSGVYYLNFGEKLSDGSCGCGAMSFTLDKENLDLMVEGGDL